MFPTTSAGRFVGVLAMLTGVLVLAFPVSVFSDLWSEELKQSKGFKNLYRDDNQDDDGSKARNNSSGRDGIIHEGDNCEQVRSVVGDAGDMYIVIKKSDLDQIVTSLHEIRENQAMIRSILRKYYNTDQGYAPVDEDGLS